jgi:hypothetical protein
MVFRKQGAVLSRGTSKTDEGMITGGWVAGTTFRCDMVSRGILTAYEMSKELYGKLSGATDLKVCNPFPERINAQRVRVEEKDYEVLLVCPYPLHYEVVLKRVA